jgi:trimethylamine---corrinoid protein Co-methyltransferase
MTDLTRQLRYGFKSRIILLSQFHEEENMQASRFEVLSATELEQIHAASMTVLAEVGVQVEYTKARDLFRAAGARVDEEKRVVYVPESLVQWAVSQAPREFTLYGRDGTFAMPVGGERVQFAGLGTPIRILDPESGQVRPTGFADVTRHIQLVDACDYIHNSQMDIWPNDIPMTTIHTRSISEWVRWSRKPYGMGCYGYLPTLDMMRLMAIVAGGKEELRKRPRFLAICSVMSPLKMAAIQIEGMFICAEYGQPIAISPEAIAGATAPVTLAGLLVQENANILAHITLAQIYRPGTPVLYGTVSTIANMRHGTVALGSVETGLITAASAQLARRYGLPCRSVGAATESKLEDIQAGTERTATLAAAVLAGVNLITCGGTLDSTMLESDALLLLDDELCGSLMRMARGIEVTPESMALDLIREVNYTGNYLQEMHTAKGYRKEHYMPRLAHREPYDAWVEGGRRSMLDDARQRVREIVARAQPQAVDPALEKEMAAYCAIVEARTIEEFYAYEQEHLQSWENL